MKKTASTPRLTPNQVALVNLGRELFAAHIQLAEKRGYIQRVQEVEARDRAPPRDPAPDAIENLRIVLADGPEQQASQILDVIPQNLLDQILGKPDVPREDGYR